MRLQIGNALLQGRNLGLDLRTRRRCIPGIVDQRRRHMSRANDQIAETMIVTLVAVPHRIPPAAIAV
jgi:hypothetical protein